MGAINTSDFPRRQIPSTTTLPHTKCGLAKGLFGWQVAMRKVALTAALVLVYLGLAHMALAQPVDRIAQLERQVAEAKSNADNSWMLVCSALVLMMTGPGLALFYGGLVRKKNVLATMMQSFAMMALITVLWALCGYSLSFAKGSPFIGGFDYLLMNGVGAAPSVYA